MSQHHRIKSAIEMANNAITAQLNGVASRPMPITEMHPRAQGSRIALQKVAAAVRLLRAPLWISNKSKTRRTISQKHLSTRGKNLSSSEFLSQNR